MQNDFNSSEMNKEISVLLNQWSGLGISFYLDDGKLKSKSRKGALTKAITDVVKQKKQQIIAFLAAQSLAENSLPDIVRQPSNGDALPLSYSQQRLWFIDNMQNGSAEYNMPMVFNVEGQINIALINDVFSHIISRHEVLRTVYQQADGQVSQKVRQMAEIEFELAVEDLTAISGEQQLDVVKQKVSADIVKPFDLAGDLMLRVKYLQTSANTGVLIFNMHHIASDGWSMNVLTNEFFALYQAFSQGMPSPLPELAIQYSDYAKWQQTYLNEQGLAKQLSYWQQQLAQVPAVHSLPLSFPRPEKKQYVGAKIFSSLAADVSQKLLALAKRHQLTPFMLLHGALSLLLARHSNSSDIVMGTPMVNRAQSELKPLIGFFVNTLVLRANTQHDSLAAYFSHIKQLHLAAQANQEVPFEHLVDKLKVTRSINHSPLFQILITTNSDFGLNEDSGAEAAVSDVAFSRYQADTVQAKFDLDIGFNLHPQGIAISWGFDVSLFTEQYIGQLSEHLCRLLTALSEVTEITERQLAPYQLPLLSTAEQHQLTSVLNDTQADYPQQSCIHQLFEAQVKRTPDALALVFEGAQLSYFDLNRQANQLAHYLIEQRKLTPDAKLIPDTLVGLCVERSPLMIVGILAILKAGGAYVPLDPSYPTARLNHMIADCGLKTIVTDGNSCAAIADYDGQIVDASDKALFADFSQENVTATAIGLSSSHLAYVIYTSGSSGQPKGVLVEHQQVMAFKPAFEQQLELLTLEANCDWLWSGSFAFDASIKGLVCLLNGGKVVMASEMASKDPKAIAALIEKHQLPVYNSTPAMVSSVIDQLNLNSGHYPQLMVSGEAVTATIYKQLQHYAKQFNRQVINAYGPTETTINSTFGLINHQLSIGKPIKNTVVYVLDQHQQLTPKGTVGELYIGGAGVVRGYLNQAQLTQQRFIANPFYDSNDVNSAKRLFRTGDLVRYLADDNLAFVGRSDEQVKIRGYRIELGEVESQLSKLDGVDSAYAIIRELNGAQQLLGYIKPQQELAQTEQASFIAAIKTALAEQLPQFMLPNVLMLVQSWPLMPNGKLDKKALPAPDGSAIQAQYVAPQTKTEMTLVDVWSQLLNIPADKISTNANFFELGGHSLLLVQLMGQLQQHQWQVEVSELYRSPSLADLANLLDSKELNQGFDIPENIIPDDCKALTPDLLPLISITQQQLDQVVAQIPSGVSNIQDIYPLGPLQQGMLYHHQLFASEQADPYMLEMYFEFSDHSKTAFIAAINHIITRHDALRTVFIHQGVSEPVQVVLKHSTLKVTEIDGVDFSDENQRDDHHVSLNLSQAPAIELVISKKADDGYTGALFYHHIVNDHEGLDILQREMRWILSNQQDKLAPPVCYRNVIAHLQRHDHGASQAYFSQQLSKITEPTIPYGIATVLQDKHNTNTRVAGFSLQHSGLIRQWCQSRRITPAAFFHSVYGLVLARVSQHTEQAVVFGTVLSGRAQPGRDFTNAMGLLINTLPVVLELNQQNADELVLQAAERLVDLVAHEQFSLAQAQQCSSIEGNGPLFTALFNYRHNKFVDSANSQAEDIDNTMLQQVRSLAVVEHTNYPLLVSLNDNGEDYGFNFNVEADKRIDVDKLVEYFQHTAINLIDRLTANEAVACQSIEILPPNEVGQLIAELNDVALDYPKDKCIHQLFEQQAALYPDNIALVFAAAQSDSNQQSLSYRELNQRANQLAHFLVAEHQVTPDTLVGLCVERSVETVIGILAILKAGGAYVPLDPNYPKDRLEYMYTDASLDIILSHSSVIETSDVLSGFNGQIINVDAQHHFSEHSKENPVISDIGLESSHLAYVIYTSGSTGQSKGVLQTHTNVVRLFAATEHEFNFDQNDCWCLFHSISFDFSVWELWGALIHGGKLLIPSEQVIHDPACLVNHFNQQQLTVLNQTPSAFKALIDYVTDNQLTLASLKQVIFGGEALAKHHIEQWFANSKLCQRAQLINMYGITETTVHVTFSKVASLDDIAIGQALKDQSIIVLDHSLSLVPKGVEGEAYVGGNGLARGYLNRDNLTKERFIDNPYHQVDNPNSPARLYRTGDLVRYQPDGDLAFVGRVDDQVKVRGYRIELGEVEACLSAQSGVDSALVMTKALAGTMQLVGYVKLNTADDDTDLLTQIKTGLASQLPAHMVPTVLLPVSQWPLTPNGKVDRKALPEPSGDSFAGVYVSAENETEQALVDIWASLLDIDADSISTTANFFELGGHSLLIIRLISAIRTRFEVELPVRDVFDNNQIKQLAVQIDKFRAFLVANDELNQDEYEDFSL